MGRLIKKAALTRSPLAIEHADERLLSLVSAQQQKNAFIQDARDGIIELSLKMAEIIVGHAVEATPTLLSHRYDEALGQVDSLTPGTVRIHPIGKEQTNIEQKAAAVGFEVLLDASLNPVDCIVEAGGVRVDSTLATALYIFKKEMETL